MIIEISTQILIIGVILAGSFFYLKQKEKQQEEVKEENLDKKILIYLGISFVAIIGLAIALYNLFPDNSYIQNVRTLVLISFLVPLAWKDYYQYIIPNMVLLWMTLIRLIIYIGEFIEYKKEFFTIIKDDVLAFLLIGTFLIIVHFLFKGSIGMGDIKLIMVMSFYQGFIGVFSSLFFSLIITAILSIVLLISKKKKRKDTVPFAPSVLIGTYLSVMCSGI